VPPRRPPGRARQRNLLDHFYYDFFCICEPNFTRDSGQIHLATILQDLGLPLAAAAKHKPMSCCRFIFLLGVEADFSTFGATGQGQGSRSASRRSAATELATRCSNHVLHENSLPQGAAATAKLSLSGRLMFATSWACGHIGRAVLHPIYDQAPQTRDKRLLPSVRGALVFSVGVAPLARRLPAA